MTPKRKASRLTTQILSLCLAFLFAMYNRASTLRLVPGGIDDLPSTCSRETCCTCGNHFLFHCDYACGSARKFVSFDVPGARTTYATAINASGQVAGTYMDQNFMNHGFLRESDGTITSFDASSQTLSISVVGINVAGQIAGYAYDSVLHNISFIRESDGTITLVAVP